MVLGLCRCEAFLSCGKRGLLWRSGWLPSAQALRRGLQWFWLPGSGAQVTSCGVRGLVAPKHVGSSRTWDQTRVSCIGRHVLYHWATREAWDHILTSDFCWNLGLRNSKWIFKILFTYLEVKMWYILKSHRHQFRLFPSHPSQPFQLNYSLYYLGIIDYTRKESALSVGIIFKILRRRWLYHFIKLILCMSSQFAVTCHFNLLIPRIPVVILEVVFLNGLWS